MLNQCNFIGRLTKEPEMRYTTGGTAVTKFTIAVSEKYKDKEDTQFIDIVMWSKLAEISGEYLSKGSLVFISGKWKTDSWEHEGKKHYRTSIIAREMKMLSPKKDGKSNSDTNAKKQSSSEDVVEEDIPF